MLDLKTMTGSRMERGKMRGSVEMTKDKLYFLSFNVPISHLFSDLSITPTSHRFLGLSCHYHDF
jgi:hypothetical protein